MVGRAVGGGAAASLGEIANPHRVAADHSGVGEVVAWAGPTAAYLAKVAEAARGAARASGAGGIGAVGQPVLVIVQPVGAGVGTERGFPAPSAQAAVAARAGAAAVATLIEAGAELETAATEKQRDRGQDDSSHLRETSTVKAVPRGPNEREGRTGSPVVCDTDQIPAAAKTTAAATPPHISPSMS